MSDRTAAISGDNTSDDASDITWMTYAELGQARGISAASAKRLAIRRRWRRHRGNDGTARVAVPVTERAPREPITRDNTGDDTGDAPSDITPVIRAFETALAELRAAKDGQLSILREQLEWADRKIAGLEADLKASQEAAWAERDALRQAEAARRGQGLWRRLKAAWRGE